LDYFVNGNVTSSPPLSSMSIVDDGTSARTLAACAKLSCEPRTPENWQATSRIRETTIGGRE